MHTVNHGSKRILAALLALLLLFSANLTAFAANGFCYEHDPRENAAAMRDIIADETAIYGFRPSETGSLRLYADADWTDPVVVSQGRVDRIAYHESVESMYVMLQEMQSQGKSIEEIARALSNRRNEIRLEAYANDPEGLADLKARNLEKYGHEEGPLPDELYEKYGSWERVLEKAFSTNAGMDACLGLYDDYYFLYVAMGDVPADVTIKMPGRLSCRFKNTVKLTPVIETNAISYTVSFVSSDPKIASIDKNGVVTGAWFGEATVWCVVSDAGGNEHRSEPCRIQVKIPFCKWLNQLFTLFKSVFSILNQVNIRYYRSNRIKGSV